jgi:hypothetical protein
VEIPKCGSLEPSLEPHGIHIKDDADVFWWWSLGEDATDVVGQLSC